MKLDHTRYGNAQSKTIFYYVTVGSVVCLLNRSTVVCTENSVITYMQGKAKNVFTNRSSLYPNKDLSTDCSVKYSIFYDERFRLVTSNYYLARIRGNF